VAERDVDGDGRTAMPLRDLGNPQGDILKRGAGREREDECGILETDGNLVASTGQARHRSLLFVEHFNVAMKPRQRYRGGGREVKSCSSSMTARHSLRHPQRLAAVVLLLAFPAAAAPQGVWLTEDGEGAVEIFDCGDLLCGRIVWRKSALRADGSADIDDRNPDPALRRRPICGLQIIGSLAASDAATWDGGWVYDPDSGKTYHVKLTMESADTLRLRGYIGVPLLGESQIWRRASADLPSCRP
jgi:uncharacterized protein (DUF2147 family)